MRARDAARPRTYDVPNHWSLELTVPEGWKESIQQPPRDLPPTVELSPATGNDFVVLITPRIVQPGAADHAEPLDLDGEPGAKGE